MGTPQSPAGALTAMRGKTAGFNLIELMIVVAIASILAVIAYPSYQNKVYQSRRADAHAMLLDAAMRQERFNSDNNTYTTNLTLLGYTSNPAISPDGFYSVAVAAAAGGIANGFTLTATALAPQTGDTQCATITLTSTGVKSSSAGVGRCW